MSENHEKLIMDVLSYHRHVGVDLKRLRSYVRGKETTRHTTKSDLAVLERLAKKGVTLSTGTRWYLSWDAVKAARGEAQRPVLLSQDSWILLAVLMGGKRLPGIIAVADYIDHAIPTHDDLYGALNRLLSVRLIRFRKREVTPTDRANELYSAVKATCRRAVLSKRKGLERILDCPCCGVSLKKVSWRIPISAESYTEAVAEYHKSMGYQ